MARMEESARGVSRDGQDGRVTVASLRAAKGRSSRVAGISIQATRLLRRLRLLAMTLPQSLPIPPILPIRPILPTIPYPPILLP